MFTLTQLVALAESLYWPFMRLSALFLAAPVFGAVNVPVRARVMLALFIAALVAPTLPPPPDIDVLSMAGMLLTAHELLVGLVMGFMVQMVFGAVVIGGQSLAMTIGLGFAMSVDPQNGVQVPVLSQLYTILATLVFLAVDAHLLLLGALADSYALLPVGAAALGANVLPGLVLLGSQMFLSGLLLVLPAITAVLLVNLAFGVITRAAPQLNIFAVGFPVTILAGFLFIFLSLPPTFRLLESMFTTGLVEHFGLLR